MGKKLVALALVAVCVLSLAATAFAAGPTKAQIMAGINNCRAAINRCNAEIKAGRNVANNTRLRNGYISQLNQLYVMYYKAKK